MSSRSSRTIYVGNLPGDIRMREIEDLFMKYGPIVDIDLKIPPRPPGYAFIEFKDPRDADDAIYGRDGCNFDGYRLRVELAHGRRGYSSSADRFSSYSRSSSSRGASRRSDYRVLVTGLPASASWQDLKDHMRQAGDVCFSQVFRDRRGMTGVVDYTNYDDMKYAVDNTEQEDTTTSLCLSGNWMILNLEMLFLGPTYGLRNMILVMGILEAPVMTQGRATLEVPVVVHMCREVEVAVAVAAVALGARAEAYHRMWNIHATLLGLPHLPLQDLGQDLDPQFVLLIMELFAGRHQDPEAYPVSLVTSI